MRKYMEDVINKTADEIIEKIEMLSEFTMMTGRFLEDTNDVIIKAYVNTVKGSVIEILSYKRVFMSKEEMDKVLYYIECLIINRCIEKLKERLISKNPIYDIMH